MSKESGKMVKMIELAESHLSEGENIVYKVLGMYMGAVSDGQTWSRGIMVATDKRLMFCNKKHLASFDYNKILESNLSKKTLNGRELSFSYNKNKIELVHIKDSSDIEDLYKLLNNPENDYGTDFMDLFDGTEVKLNVKQIKETKCTCSACGNVWYYGKEESLQNFSNKLESASSSMSNAGKDMMCCTGCLPALFMPQKQEKVVRDLNQCPNCNSKAVEKEDVVHDVG